MRPTVGRIVHYVSYGTPGGEHKPECRAAIVTAVSPITSPLAMRGQEVDLAVLNPTGMYFNQACKQDEGDPDRGGYPGGTWHWPERSE